MSPSEKNKILQFFLGENKPTGLVSFQFSFAPSEHSSTDWSWYTEREGLEKYKCSHEPMTTWPHACKGFKVRQLRVLRLKEIPKLSSMTSMGCSTFPRPGRFKSLVADINQLNLKASHYFLQRHLERERNVVGLVADKVANLGHQLSSIFVRHNSQFSRPSILICFPVVVREDSTCNCLLLSLFYFHIKKKKKNFLGPRPHHSSSLHK